MIVAGHVNITLKPIIFRSHCNQLLHATIFYILNRFGEKRCILITCHLLAVHRSYSPKGHFFKKIIPQFKAGKEAQNHYMVFETPNLRPKTLLLGFAVP